MMAVISLYPHAGEQSGCVARAAIHVATVLFRYLLHSPHPWTWIQAIVANDPGASVSKWPLNKTVQQYISSQILWLKGQLMLRKNKESVKKPD